MVARNNFFDNSQRSRAVSISRGVLTSGLRCSRALSVTSAYSVLSHQAIIDSAWEDGLEPALLARFPNATPEELSAAAGLCIRRRDYSRPRLLSIRAAIFSAILTHYVRSGDFHQWRSCHDANDIYEYGFAFGRDGRTTPADNNGHRIGTNRAVARCSIRI